MEIDRAVYWLGQQGVITLLHDPITREAIDALVSYVKKHRDEEWDKKAEEAIKKEMPKRRAYRIREVSIGDKKEIIKIPVCPTCRTQIINFGHGWVCVNPSCRQRIEQKKTERTADRGEGENERAVSGY